MYVGLVLWGLSGLAIAGLMYRRGHNFWINAFIGVGYGPFLTVIWLQSRLHQSDEEHVVVGRTEPLPFGHLYVLVGLDGSEQSLRSVGALVDMLGSSIRRMRLVSVIDHELTDAADIYEVDERRIDHLEEAAMTLGFPNAEISLLKGRPSNALAAHGLANDFDMLIVGHRHNAVTSALLGSTSTQLARSAGLPVLVGPAVKSSVPYRDRLAAVVS